MYRVDRHKLHFSPYRTPPFRYGTKVECEARGEVTITRLSDGPIQWPMYRKSLILYKDLARAVRREASIAIQHWWGVGAMTVCRWRRALGVPRMNEGDLRLKSEHARTDWADAARQKAYANARNPERCAKIAAARRGKPRPKHVIEAMRKTHLGRPLSAEHRRKLSEAQKRRGTRPPAAALAWAPWEIELLKTLPASEVAEKTGRTLVAVFICRNRMG
jgi:nucleotide-binding universal stress UspA family protein